jgi:hypothetical protein
MTGLRPEVLIRMTASNLLPAAYSLARAFVAFVETVNRV